MRNKTLFFALCATFVFSNCSSTNAQTSLSNLNSFTSNGQLIQNTHVAPNVAQLPNNEVVVVPTITSPKAEAMALPTSTPAPVTLPSQAPIVSHTQAPSIQPPVFTPAIHSPLTLAPAPMMEPACFGGS